MRFTSGTWLSLALAVLACASTFAVFATRDVPTTSDSALSEPHLLSAFRSEDVTRLELLENGQKLLLERASPAGSTAQFRLLEPVKESADPAVVDKLLSTLSGARALRPVEQGSSLAALGLDKPGLRVTAQSAKHSYRLALGGKAPTPEGARYVQVSNDGDAPRSFVIAKAVADDLSVTLDAFRLHSLVTVNEADVTRVAITGPKSNIDLERGPGGQFRIASEGRVLANRETLKSLFFQLSRLTASDFLSESDAEAALGPARTRFELTLADPKQKLIFDAGGSCPSDATQLVVVRRAPDVQRACAPRELEATLALAATDFVDRRAFSLRADEVEELEISGGKNKYALRRKGAGFLLHTNRETQVELEAGNQRIAELLEAEGERVPVPSDQLSALGLEPAASTITLRSSAARDADVVQQVVRVGNRDANGNLLVFREQDQVVLRIPRDLARGFAVDSTLLYSRKLTEFGLSSFLSAEIQSPQTRQVLRRVNDALRLEQPPGFEADGVLSSDLVQTLGALTAERFVADRDDGSFGLQRAALSVRFAFKNADGNQIEHHLRFGLDTTLGVFATLADDGPVFVLPRSVRDTCQVLLLNRAVFPTSSDAFNGVTIEAHGRVVQLTRRGERLVASTVGFPQDRVPELLEALGNLRAEAALHAGPALAAEGFSAPSMTLRLQPRQGAAQTLSFGAGDSWRSTSVFYMRVSGIDATYVIAQSKVRALSDAL